jgi:hypothetical protein
LSPAALLAVTAPSPLTKDDPGFDAAIEKRVRDLKQRSKWLADDAKRETQRLKTWKPAAA